MPLKLTPPDKVDQDELDRRFLKKHEELLKPLAETIEAITRAHRDEYEAWLNTMFWDRLSSFLTRRGANGTTRDVYGDGGLDERYRDQYTPNDVPGPPFLREVTNYYEALESILPQPKNKTYGLLHEEREARKAVLKDKNRPAFVVKLKKDAKAIIARDVKRDVDAIVAQFVHKTCMKLVGVLRRYPGYQVLLKHGSYNAGTFQGEMLIDFLGGLKFSVRLQLKHNQTKYGDPYLQWPMTFHDVSYPQGNKIEFAASMAQEVVESVFNAVKREVEKSTVKFWGSVGVGHVVKLKNDKLALVVSTRGDKAKVMYQNGTEADAVADDIVAALYKIKARHSYNPKDHFYAYVESADTEKKVPRVDLTEDEAKPVYAIDSYSFNKREAKAREVVFKRLMREGKL